ncbi:MAG TPA: deoxyribose-phosphate aldolase [Streptosporangiaceae bacterium]|nr:deoxyribose-phosphate aldolase [Streptosporangiaceae bacterium]
MTDVLTVPSARPQSQQSPPSPQNSPGETRIGTPPWSAADAARDNASLRRFLHGLPGVDQAGAESRAAGLATRSIKTTAKAWAITTSISMIDLTSLEGADTPARVRSLCARAMRPDLSRPDTPMVAAVCVYPDLVATAVDALRGSPVGVASVATAFPSGRASLATKLADVRDAVAAGANEIDMVIDRGAFLAGRYTEVFNEILAVKTECSPAHLKVILETGELGTLDHVRRASWLALLAGGDFIKTSTGKISPAATPPVALVMLQAAKNFAEMTGQARGVKLAGGIRTTKEAVRYLVMVNEVAGSTWLTPDLFRFGASSLLNDLLLQWHKLKTGAYDGPDYVAVD